MRITKINNVSLSSDLIGDIRSLIETARHNVAVTVNAGLTILYWQIGNRIRQDILKEKRAEYGKEIVGTLSQQLTNDYGNNFNEKNLRRMIQFKNNIQRDFYAEMCRIERWSVRTLREKDDGMLYDRTAISKKPEELIEKDLVALREEDRLTPDLVFRDPYFLDFLGSSLQARTCLAVDQASTRIDFE